MSLLVYRHADGRKMRIRPGNPTSHVSLVAQGFLPPDEDLGFERLSVIDGVDPDMERTLYGLGFFAVADVLGASDDALLAVPGIGPKTLARIREYATGVAD